MNGLEHDGQGGLEWADAFADKKILITGGTGYIAASIIGFLKDLRCHVIRLGRDRNKFSPVKGTARIEDMLGDVANPSVWESLPKNLDIIIHLAAQTSVYVAAENPLTDLRANIAPILGLLEVCRKRLRRPTLVFAGTATQVGLTPNRPVNESSEDRPITIYDLHKLIAEKYLKLYSIEGHVCGATLRLANVYGPGPASSGSDRGVINKMMTRALNGETLTVFGTGEYVRDYVHVSDVARAFLAAAGHPEKTKGRNFVIGSGRGITLGNAVELVADYAFIKTGVRPKVIYTEMPTTLHAIEKRNFVADPQAFQEATGWAPRIPLETGIKMTMDALAGGRQ